MEPLVAWQRPDQGQLEGDEEQQGAAAAGSSSSKKQPPEQRRRCMSDKFMMYTYKIKLCKRQDPHNWRLCPYAHPGEAGKRRPPHAYQAAMCDFSKTRKECSHGEDCLLARNALEYWLHPDKYRTIMCGHGEACSRNICFFAHNQQELRVPGAGPGAAAAAAAGEAEAEPYAAAAAEALQQLSISGPTGGQPGAALVFVGQAAAAGGGAAGGSVAGFGLQPPPEQLAGAQQQQQQQQGLMLPVEVSGGSPGLPAMSAGFAMPGGVQQGGVVLPPAYQLPQPPHTPHYDYPQQQQPLPPPPGRHGLYVPQQQARAAPTPRLGAGGGGPAMQQQQQQQVFQGWAAHAPPPPPQHQHQQQQQVVPGGQGVHAVPPPYVALPLAAMSQGHAMMMAHHPGGGAHPALLYPPYAPQPFQQQQFQAPVFGFQPPPQHPGQLLMMAPPGSSRGPGGRQMLVTLPPGVAAAQGAANPDPTAAAAAGAAHSPHAAADAQYGMHLPQGGW